MADAFTPALNLCQPEVGASRDSWGSKWNQNATILDQFVSRSMPIGGLLDYAGPTPPSGWLICDGRLISRVTYSDLFNVIGVLFGSGDGSTTFALPSLNGRSTVGPGTVIDQIGTSTTFTLGQQFGMVYNYISQTHLPAYNLVTDYQGLHAHGGASQAAGGGTFATDPNGGHTHTTDLFPAHTHTGVTDLFPAHTHNYQTVLVQAGNNVGGSPAVTISGNQIAQTDAQGAHTHALGINAAGAHTHQTDLQGIHQHSVTISAHTHAIIADGNHAHNVNLGGGGNPFEVMSPILVVTKIIYAGSQASTRAALDAASVAPSATDSTDEMAAIREELAALRALFAPAARRVPTTPLRGMN